jgi:predicted nucleic acid-binding protein
MLDIAIWTNDKALSDQDNIKVISTTELLNFFPE